MPRWDTKHRWFRDGRVVRADVDVIEALIDDEDNLVARTRARQGANIIEVRTVFVPSGTVLGQSIAELMGERP